MHKILEIIITTYDFDFVVIFNTQKNKIFCENKHKHKSNFFDVFFIFVKCIIIKKQIIFIFQFNLFNLNHDFFF